ncbi:MAG: class I SAM-dependent methyltransferase [Burkholderiales bacterium]|nr:class I SAM-dependent methyltransferase [Burkholderiales bacterium]
MLLKVLKEAARVLAPRRRDAPAYPLEAEQRLNELHARAPVERHLELLFHDTRIGAESYVALHRRCLEATGTGLTPFNVFQRFQTRLVLVNYFLATLSVPGARAECGAYRGATALLLCHARRAREPGYRGADFHLIDSFAGASASGRHDLIAVRGANGEARREAFFPEGKSDASVESVRAAFAEFPGAAIHAGWIPRVFHELPERDWAFVRLDLTLYEPTRAALEYFHPRLSPGGVIFCDGSILCPGAEHAWEEYCERHRVPCVVLGHRQFVLLK